MSKAISPSTRHCPQSGKTRRGCCRIAANSLAVPASQAGFATVVLLQVVLVGTYFAVVLVGRT